VGPAGNPTTVALPHCRRIPGQFLQTVNRSHFFFEAGIGTLDDQFQSASFFSVTSYQLAALKLSLHDGIFCHNINSINS
jgi:hypothetical protein